MSSIGRNTFTMLSLKLDLKYHHVRFEIQTVIIVRNLRDIFQSLHEIHLTLKLTQYLTNIFKMRFLMRNCIKYAQQCQNGIF